MNVKMKNYRMNYFFRRKFLRLKREYVEKKTS